MAYLAMTQTIGQWIDRGVFQDGRSMARYVVAFANEYRRALADSAGSPRRQPTISVAWQQSFDACAERREIFQCLMLGINAHMKRDLPYAIVAAGVDVNSTVCYDDHILVDDILKINLPVVQRRIAGAYGGELSLGQRWLGHFAIARIHREFKDARKSSWEHARLLAGANTAAARAEAGRMIEDHAAAEGRKILGLKSEAA